MDAQASRLRRLVAMEAAAHPDLPFEMNRLLKDPSVLQITGLLTAEFGALDDDQAPHCKGLFGFLLFVSAAERSDKETADRYVAAPSVLNYMFALYGIRETDRKSSFAFYRLGSTSFIVLMSDAGRVRVLKLIKPAFLDNQRIRAETQGYRDKVAACQDEHMPMVEFSSETHMVMAFVRGMTLAEYMDVGLWDPDGDAIERIQMIIGRVSLVLSNYAAHGLAHGDLSPDNIIVRPDITTEPPSFHVHLLDFGINYVLREASIRSTALLLRAERYVAPEIRRDPAARETTESDMYSLGAILLELLFTGLRRNADRLSTTLPIQVLPQDELSRQDFANVVDRLRLEYHGLGDVLDELLDDDPRWRTSSLREEGATSGATPAVTAPRLYSELKKRIDTELRIYRGVYTERVRGFTWALVDGAIASADSVMQRIVEAYFLSKHHIGDRRRAYTLLAWLGVTQLLHGVMMWKFFELVVGDWKGGQLDLNLPGRLVALSFSYVAARYYANIFSNISPHSVSRGAAVAFRATACAEWIPIFVALYWPLSWPFCVLAGSLVITTNNCFAQSLCRRAEQSGRPLSGLARFAFYEWTGWWPQTLVVYGLATLSLGVFTGIGWVHDVWPYALIMLGINVRNYFYPCTFGAALSRCGLQTAIAVLRRSGAR